MWGEGCGTGRVACSGACGLVPKQPAECCCRWVGALCVVQQYIAAVHRHVALLCTLLWLHGGH
jgi:hypothetical protein